MTGTKGDGTPITPITVTTNTNGGYQFTNLAPGTYTVTFTKPTNTVTTTPDQGGDDSKDSDASITTIAVSPVTVQSGETNNTIDAGYLREQVWEIMYGKIPMRMEYKIVASQERRRDGKIRRCKWQSGQRHQ